jgi:hypothetical protein
VFGCLNRKPLNSIKRIGMGLIAPVSINVENNAENKACDGIEDL